VHQNSFSAGAYWESYSDDPPDSLIGQGADECKGC